MAPSKCVSDCQMDATPIDKVARHDDISCSEIDWFDAYAKDEHADNEVAGEQCAREGVCDNVVAE